MSIDEFLQQVMGVAIWAILIAGGIIVITSLLSYALRRLV